MSIRRVNINAQSTRFIVGPMIKGRAEFDYRYTYIVNGSFGGGTVTPEYGVPAAVALGATQTYTWYPVFSTAGAQIALTANAMGNGQLNCGNDLKRPVLLGFSIGAATTPNVNVIVSDNR